MVIAVQPAAGREVKTSNVILHHMKDSSLAGSLRVT